MSKYKVGDKLKIKDDLKFILAYTNKVKQERLEAEYRNRTTCVTRVFDNGQYKVDIDNGKYRWTNNDFEGLAIEGAKSVFKVGDTVELLSIDDWDKAYKLKVGDKGVIKSVGEYTDACRIYFENIIEVVLIYYKQLKLAEPNTIEEPSQSIPNKGTIKYRITDDGITYATLNGSKTGKSVKSNKDKASNEIGILIADRYTNSYCKNVKYR